MLTCLLVDWAGGPGDSKDDVEWLDKQLAQFFGGRFESVIAIR